jgi:hypothetical protein
MDPRIIQLVIVAAAIWLPVVALVALYFFRKLQLQQRLQVIERGAEPTADPAGAVARTRRAGIVCVSTGLGLSAANLIVVAASGNLQALVFQAVGVVPLAIGIGLLVDYRLARRDLEARR